VRDTVRVAFSSIASRFSSDAPSVDAVALRSRYRAFEAWPADAELGLIVLAWVLGPGFHIRGFREAVNAVVPEFDQSALLLGPGTTPTLVTLYGIARTGFRNATLVLRWDLNPDILYAPQELSRCIGATPL
jgi:hypothetical protein